MDKIQNTLIPDLDLYRQLERSPSVALGETKEGGQDLHAEELGKVSQDFESIFLEIVLRSMRSSVMKADLFDGGHAEEIYRGMLDGEYAKSMAHQDTTGLAHMIERELRSKMEMIKQTKTERTQGEKAYNIFRSPQIEMK